MEQQTGHKMLLKEDYSRRKAMPCKAYADLNQPWKPGCCVIHMGGSVSSLASTDSLFLATTQSISEQQTHFLTRFNR